MRFASWYIIGSCIITILSVAHCCPKPRWLEKNIEILSTENVTIADEIKGNSKAIDSLKQLQHYFEDLNKRIAQPDELTGAPRECSTDKLKTIINLFRNYGFGDIEQCQRVIHFSDSDPASRNKKSEILFQSIQDFANALKKAGSKAVKQSKLRWNKNGKVYDGMIFEGNSRTSSCELARATAYRINGTWMTVASMTNYPINDIAQAGRRLSYIQVLHANSKGFVEYYPMKFSKTCEGNKTLETQEGSASISYQQGKASWSSFHKFELNENPALAKARSKFNNIMERFDDFESKSDIAISLLPVVLAVIPLGLFQDITSISSLSLILLTDVLSAIPIGIKSMELLREADSARYMMEAYIYGSETLSEPGAAEVWMTKCGLKKNLYATGRILLITTCSAIILAVGFDIAVVRLLSRQKKLFKQHANKRGIGLPSAGLFWYINRENWPRTEHENNSFSSS